MYPLDTLVLEALQQTLLGMLHVHSLHEGCIGQVLLQDGCRHVYLTQLGDSQQLGHSLF